MIGRKAARNIVEIPIKLEFSASVGFICKEQLSLCAENMELNLHTFLKLFFFTETKKLTHCAVVDCFFQLCMLLHLSCLCLASNSSFLCSCMFWCVVDDDITVGCAMY